MVKLLEIYKCEVCGNIIELVHIGMSNPVCCDQPMKLMRENTVDASKEKHVPVIEKTDKGFRVKIGSLPHPMEEKHYIEWIQIIAGGKVYREFLKPGDRPEAEFCLPVRQAGIQAEKIEAREYCNLHGLWKA